MSPNQTLENKTTTTAHIVEGQCWHYGAITKPGKFDSFYLPLNVGPNDDLRGRLEYRRDELLSRYALTDPDLTVAENKSWRVDESGDLILILRWKQTDIDRLRTCVVDDDNAPLIKTNQQLMDARFKLSFNQCAWRFDGRCGSKLKPRKIQLLQMATFSDVVGGQEFTETSSYADF